MPIGSVLRPPLAERIARVQADAAAGRMNPRPEDAHAAECARQSRQKWATDRMAWNAGVPRRYEGASLSDLSRVPAADVAVYSQKAESLRRLLREPVIVALCGPRGVGKTWLACAAVNHFNACGHSAKYAEATDYFLALKATYGPQSQEDQVAVEKKYLGPSLLVLDEMHERGDTDWEDRMLTRLINKRYTAGRATLLISNDKPAEFKKRLGTSIADRINDGGGFVVWEGVSLRGRIAPTSV